MTHRFTEIESDFRFDLHKFPDQISDCLSYLLAQTSLSDQKHRYTTSTGTQLSPAEIKGTLRDQLYMIATGISTHRSNLKYAPKSSNQSIISKGGAHPNHHPQKARRSNGYNRCGGTKATQMSALGSLPCSYTWKGPHYKFIMRFPRWPSKVTRLLLLTGGARALVGPTAASRQQWQVQKEFGDSNCLSGKDSK